MAGDVAFQISLQDDVSPAAQSAAGAFGRIEAALSGAASALERIASRFGAVSSAAQRMAADETAAAGAIAAQGRESERAAGSADRLAQAEAKSAARQMAAEKRDAAKALAQQEREAAKAARAAERLAAAEAKSAAKKLADDQRTAAKALQATERAAAKAAKEAEHLAQAQGKTGASASAAGGGFASFGKLLKGVAPQMGGMVERSGNLSAGLGGMPHPAAMAALAVVAVAVAVAAAAIKFAAFALATADASQHLRAMALATEGSVAAGDRLDATIRRVAGRNVVAAEEVAGLAMELRKAGLQGQEFETALDAAAASSRVFGSSAGSAFTQAAIDAKKAGKSVADLAKETKDKLGPGLAAELNRPSVAASRLGNAISGIFDDVDTSGIAKAINEIAAAFEKGSAVGDAFRAVFEALFGGISDGVGNSSSMIVGFIEECTIMFLKGAIAVKPFFRKLGELWDKFTEGGEKSVAFQTAIFAVKVAVMMIVSAFDAFDAAITAVSTALSAVGAVLSSIGGAIRTVMDGFQSFSLQGVLDSIGTFVSDAGAKLGDWASSAVNVAGDFVQGLADGIINGVGMVVDAAADLGRRTIAAIKDAFKSKSPSRVMVEIGGYAAEGLAVGMDAGASMVDASAAALAAGPIKTIDAAFAAPAAVPALAPAARPAGGGGGGVDVGGVTITINGVQGAEAILEKLPAALADAFEQLAETMGLAPAEA